MSLYFQKNNTDFIPRGTNWIDEPTPGNVVSFNVGHYNGASFDATMQQIAAYGYNTVRMFAWPDNAGNSSGAGIDPAYWANVSDAIKRAYTHGLYTILSCAGLPINGGYRPSFPAPTSPTTAYAYSANWFYLTAAALTARNQYTHDFCTALIANGVTAQMLLALELTGEIGFQHVDIAGIGGYPLNQTGSITTKTGTYSLPSQATAMMNDGILGYLNGNVGGTYQGQVSAAKAAFPGVPIMVQLQPAAYGVDPAVISFPNQTILTSGTQDAVGLSLYPTYDVPLATVIGTLGVGNPLPASYIYTALETGWLSSHSGTLMDMANASIQWISDSWTAGVFGFSWFLWDTTVTASSGYWPMTAGDYLFARLLSPANIGDGSGDPPPVPINHPTVQPEVHHELYLLDSNGNPANFINGRPVYGALAGWSGLSYSPVGAAIDKVPQNSVKVPLSDWRNIAVDTAVQILVRDTSVSADPTHGEVTRGPILDVDQTVDEHGVHWAQVSFADELYELSRADVTSSFATSQGEVLGTPIGSPATAGTIVRLLSGPPDGLLDSAWTGINEITGLDGVAFTATGSVAQTVDKLRQERFGHFRREQQLANGGTTVDPRVLRLSALGAPWMVNNNPVWFVAPGENVTAAAQNPNMRQMFTPEIKKRGEIVNSYTPSGGGNGVSQLNLRTLYGNTTFTGYDPAHPVLQRINQGGSTSDGFDYYVEDAASIALYGRTRGPLAKPDISAVVNSAGGVSVVDEMAAAVALYNTTLARLKLTALPITELTFTTPGIGDLRLCGGLTTHVRFLGYAFDPSRQVYQFLDLDDDYTILDAVRAVDDATSTAMDTFTVSSTGQAVASTGGTLLGVMDTVTAMHAGVQTYPFGRTIPKSQNIGPGTGGVSADLNVSIPADNSVVRRHWAFVYLTLSGMVHTRSDTGHTQDVVTAQTSHDLATGNTHDIGSDVGLEITDTSGAVHVTNTQSFQYDPQVNIQFNKQSSKPASAKAVYFDGTAFYWDGTDTKTKDLDSNHMSIGIVAPTAGGTGGTLTPTTGAKTGTGQIGGTVPQTTHKASAGKGALSAFATQESVYLGPSPTGVVVLIDNVQRFGPFSTSPGALDILAFVSDQAAHVVTVRSPTNGAADVIIDIRDDVSTFAVKPT